MLPIDDARRLWLGRCGAAAAVCTAGVWQVQAIAASMPSEGQAPGPSPELQAALQRFSAGVRLQTGRLKIDIDAIVENGNAVPVTVTYAGPKSSGARVVAMGLFTELNPAPDVAVFRWPPPAPGETRVDWPARVSTRMRLATSQGVTAAALLSDGSGWIHRVEVLVTLAACIEES